MSAADPHAGIPAGHYGPSAQGARLGMVLLHGRGGAAADILGLAQHLAIPEIHAIAPQAAGNSWWPTSFLAPMAQMQPYLTSALASVDRAIGELRDAGLPRERIVLAGFSQGACLVLEAAARIGGPLHSVFAFSGALIGTADAPGAPDTALYGHKPKAFVYAARLEDVPVYLGCHEQDPHIPLARVRESTNVLAAMGAQTTEQIFPGAGHGLLEPELTAMRARLNTAA